MILNGNMDTQQGMKINGMCKYVITLWSYLLKLKIGISYELVISSLGIISLRNTYLVHQKPCLKM